MKFILKLLLAPLMLVLWIVEWALTLALKVSAVVCVIASALFLLSGVFLLCGRQRAERLHLSGHCVSALALRTALFGGEAHSAVYRHEDSSQGENLRINGICGM